MKNNTVKKRLFGCTLVAAIATGYAPSLVSQETAAPANSSILSLYSDYNQAQYAVQWKVPTGDLSELRARMPRYGYLLYYTSQPLLAAQRGPFVQFGFFKSREEANQFVEDNKAAFPGLRVVNVTPSEHQALMQQTDADAAEDDSASEYFWLNDARQQNREDLQAMLKEAKVLYINRQYEKALQYYSTLSLAADPEIAHWARELKGLTHESLGQRELAISTYRQLIADGTGKESWTARVTQRLRALETAADDGKQALRESKYGKNQSPFYYRGVVGQSYNYITSGGKHRLDRDVLSAIVTNIDATAGYRHPEHEVELRVNGYGTHDLMDYPETYRYRNDDRTIIKRAQVRYTHVDTGTEAIGGRQKDSDSGMYLYFDGLTVKYPLSDKISIGVSAGVPVQFSDFYDHLDRKFYSAQASYDHNAHWRVAGYLTHQTLYGEIDRAAWGGRLQYTDDRFSGYLNLDYDYEFAEVNILRTSGSYRHDEDNQVSVTYGLQRSPFLTSTNILLGQPYLNLQEYLGEQFNRDYLLYHALQRTGIYEFGSLSYQHDVDDQLHITTDVYQAVSSDMPIFQSEDGGITSIVVTNGAEYRYTSVGVQAVAQDFLGMDDTATLSFRHADTTESSFNLIQLSERLRLWDNKIYITPKAKFKYLDRERSGDSRSDLGGSLTLTYKPWRNVELRVEAGQETIRYLEEKNSVENAYMFMGYQARF